MLSFSTVASAALIIAIGALLYLWRRMLVAERGGFVYWTWVAACAYVGVRPAVLVLRLDETFPDGAIPTADRASALNAGLVLVLLWIASTGAMVWLMTRTSRRSWRPSPSPEHDQPLLVASGVAALVASALLVWLIVRLGGPSAAISALKRDELGGNTQLFALAKNAGLVASMAGAATVVSAIRANRSRAVIVLRSLLFVIPAGLTFTVGARDAAVFGAVAVASATFHRVERLGLRSLVRMAGALAIVVLLGIGLRLARDLAVNSEVSANVADQSLVRQVSITANMTSFDALVHARYVTPSEFDFAGTTDFAASIEGLPLVPGEPSEDYERPALRIIRHHLPTRLNGNPLTPIGDWYLAFGLPGVLLGGVVGGGLLGALARRFGSAPDDALIHTIGVVTALRILPLGVSATTPSVGLQFAISTLALVLLVQGMTRMLPSTTDSVATEDHQGDTRSTASGSATKRGIQLGVAAALLGAATVVGLAGIAPARQTTLTTVDLRVEGSGRPVQPTDLAIALRRSGTETLSHALSKDRVDAVAHASAKRPFLVVSVEADDSSESARATDVVVASVLEAYPDASVSEMGIPTAPRRTPLVYLVLAGALGGAAAMGAARSLASLSRSSENE